MASPYGYSSPYAVQQAYGYGAGQSYPPGYSQYGPQQPYAAPQQPYGAPQQQYGQPAYGQPQGYAPQQNYPQPYQQPQQYGYPQPGYEPSYAQQPQSLSADQLEQMVAPIALDPDALVAQVLAASTYPQQVAQADQWLRSQGNASPYQIAGGADAQPWDPSVKALTAFPQVLDELSSNQGWTAALGNVYYNQPQDVMQAIQIMRQRAQAAGTLQSGPQETVSYDQGNIELAPPSPEMVYVPQYDPWTAYGDPVTPYPGFNLLGAIGSFFSTVGDGFLHFGPGIAMAAFNHTPFGWIGWALSWLTDAITFGHSTWSTHSTVVADWGLPYGGPRAYLGMRAGYHGSAFAGYRGSYAAGRGYEDRGRSFGSPAQTTYRRGPDEAYNRTPAPITRTQNNFSRPQAYAAPQQAFSRPAYGPEVYNGSRNSAGETQRGYAPAPIERGYNQQSYRAPQQSVARNSYSSAPGSSFRGGESYMARSEPSFKAPKSGGFHPFGGGSEFKQPRMEYKAPKMPKAPKMSSHSFGGGHSESHSSSGGGHHHWCRASDLS
jgi:hypothetical protein